MSAWNFDPSGLLAVSEANPEFVAAARGGLQAAVDAGLMPRVHEAHRSAERSDQLYKKWKSGKGGRAAPGWKSVHNYGLAMDVYLYDSKGVFINEKSYKGKGWFNYYAKLNSHLAAMQFEWGSKINDSVHFEYHPKWKGLSSGAFLDARRKWAMGLADAVNQAENASVVDWLAFVWWDAGAGGQAPQSSA